MENVVYPRCVIAKFFKSTRGGITLGTQFYYKRRRCIVTKIFKRGFEFEYTNLSFAGRIKQMSYSFWIQNKKWNKFGNLEIC